MTTNTIPRPGSPHALCVAPMMGYTDRHFRYLLRLISRRTRLYTEMVSSAALLHCSGTRILRFDPAEHPVALQLGGADPSDLARCARMGEAVGFDEINLNVGCPSDRVQNARFGACLMAEPERVADCVSAMRDAVRIPVTVKTRTGIDDLDSYDYLHTFTNAVAGAGCRMLIVHARKAWLHGLSPRENRSVPPLCYETVYRLKRDFPHLDIVVNGGIESMAQVRRHLQFVEGAMLGRAVCRDPYVLAATDREVFNDPGTSPARQEILARYMDYAEAQLAGGVSLHRLARHVLDLFRGQAGARAFRRYISEHATRRGAGLEVIDHAARLLQAA